MPLWAYSKSGCTAVGSTYTLYDARDKTRTRNLIKMIIIDLQPFSMVSDAGFLNYSFVMDPHYKVKSETYYKNIFDKFYTNGMEKVKKKLINDKPSVISVQLDRWSGNHNSHVGVIINYITDGFKRVSLPICCEKFNESHSANNRSIWLDKKLEDWEVKDKVKVIVSDSAANMQAMVDQMYDVQHVKCLNHVLNLIVKDEILEKPQIRKLIETVRKISNFPNLSVFFAEAVRSKCIERNCAVQALVPDVVTRWNSTLDMLVRFIELEDVIKDVLFVDGWNERVMDSSSISSADWKLMKNVISVLKPFKSATLKLSSVSACVSEYIPTVTCLVKSLETQTQNDEGVVSLKRRLAENLRSRTGHMMKNLTKMQVTLIEATDYLAIATLLDSRFKDKFFLDPAKLLVAKDGLLALLKDKYDSDFGNADVQVDRTVEVADQRDTQEDVFASMFDQIAKAAAVATPSTVDTPESTLMEYFNA